MPKWTEEQTQAIYKKGKNIIVSAGAGSGKTAVLSQRVLEHVKSGINIDELLILTFTNAAAQEMKERIRKKIKEVPELKDQLDKIDIAYITTFDAYSLSLVKKYHDYLNISNKINIIDNSIMTIEKEQILEEIFLEYYESKNEKFLKLINDFCLKDDSEIKRAILTLNNKLDNKYDKEKILDTYIDSYYQDNVVDKYINEYMKLIKKKIHSIAKQIDNLGYYVDSEYINKLYDVVNPILNSKSYEEIKFSSANFGRMPILRGAEDSAKVIKDEIKNLINELRELTKYNNLEEIKNSIYITKDITYIIIELVKELDKRVREYKRKNNAYEFVDISKMAIGILEKFEDIRNDLKCTYKEILIDEYQDTNDLQDMFISYIENNNVYMVGDIKQSIYRFRNANPMLFKKKYDAYTDGILGEKIDLNRNFRSRSEVLNNINLIFNLIMDLDIGGADYILSHQMIFGLTSYNEHSHENYNMEILNYEELEDKSFTKEEIEIFTIAQDIKKKIDNHYRIMDKDTMQSREVTYGDFVILMDRSTSFNLYKKVFEYLNIPLTIYRDNTISNSVDISIIKNIYNLLVLIDKKDFGVSFSYSFMAVARSYLFRMSDKEILKIINTRGYASTKIYEICYKIVCEMDDLNNKEIFERIIEEFKFYENSVAVGNVLNNSITISSIGKIVDNTVSFGYGPEEFLEYLNMVSDKGLDIKLSLNKESANSVKIMTIHTSKGLEYPICYFSGLYKNFNVDDLKNKFYYDNTYGFVVPYIDKGIKSSIVKTLLKQKYMEEEIAEKLRLFYVGLTRAREAMIMVGSFKKNELAIKDGAVINNEARLKIRNFADIIEDVYDVVKAYMKDIDTTKIGLTKEYNLRKNKDYKDLIDNSGVIEVEDREILEEKVTSARYSKASKSILSVEDTKNMEFGTKMHYLLEITDFSSPNYEGLNDFESRCIKEFINTGILRGAVKIYKEYEFLYEEESQERHGIIDLLIIKENECIIVDYKLKNTKDEAYVRQLRGYKNYVNYMTSKDTKTYLYSILDSKLVLID